VGFGVQSLIGILKKTSFESFLSDLI